MILCFAVAAVLSAFCTRLSLFYLKRRAILDQPNDRSSHSIATPRGGGIGVIAALLIVGGAIVFDQMPVSGEMARGLLGTLALASCLGIVSWADDLYGLPPAPRFIAQIIAVSLGISLLPDQAPVFQGLVSPWTDHLLAGIAWLWFINLTNFMDGIDGITATETASIGAGLALILGLVVSVEGSAVLALTGAALAGVSVGFFVWNRPPASVFLGDVGAIPLGFVLGWLLLATAAHGFLAVALILPLYYVADATLTLFKRIIRREKVWQAHRSHFYQQAVKVFEGKDGTRRTSAHRRILVVILACNIALIDIAASAAAVPAQTILLSITAVLAVAVLLWYLATRKPDNDT